VDEKFVAICFGTSQGHLTNKTTIENSKFLTRFDDYLLALSKAFNEMKHASSLGIYNVFAFTLALLLCHFQD
jgi:hypothetical protein